MRTRRTSRWPSGRAEHARPLLAHVVPAGIGDRAQQLRNDLGDLARDRPLAALAAAAAIGSWSRLTSETAARNARLLGTSWADIGAAPGISTQAARERFGREGALDEVTPTRECPTG
jgi:hypothetical protein